MASSAKPAQVNKPAPVLVKPRRPMGVVAPLVPAEIEVLARITDADLLRIRDELDPELAALLDAKPMQPTQTARGR